MRWWRIVLNTALWGVQGVVAAGVLALVWHSAGWADQMPEHMMIPMTILLAAVIEGLNLVLVMTSQYLAGATTPRAYLADWRSQVAIGTLDLTAPIPAALAAAQPALLPLLAVAMVAAQAGLGAVTSRTAQAGTDPLTSVPNRAYLLARLKSRLPAPEVDRHPVTVLLIDLDRFKQINDDLGHLVGDQVLVEVARRLEESTRSSDVVARFGGDEFAVLLTGGSGQRNAEEVAGRIRAAVTRPIHVAGRSVRGRGHHRLGPGRPARHGSVDAAPAGGRPPVRREGGPAPGDIPAGPTSGRSLPGGGDGAGERRGRGAGAEDRGGRPTGRGTLCRTDLVQHARPSDRGA